MQPYAHCYAGSTAMKSRQLYNPCNQCTRHIKFHKADMKSSIWYNFVIISVSTCININKAISKTMYVY